MLVPNGLKQIGCQKIIWIQEGFNLDLTPSTQAKVGGKMTLPGKPQQARVRNFQLSLYPYLNDTLLVMLSLGLAKTRLQTVHRGANLLRQLNL